MTKIKKVNLYRAVSPLSKPIADSTHQIPEIAFVITEVVLENGITGEGYLLAFHYSPNAIAGAMKDIKDFAVGYHTYQTGQCVADYEKETEYFGNNGLQKWALATLNVAMWDAWAKTLKQPIWKLFGQTVHRVPVYGSGGWLSYSDEELLEEVTAYKKRGFTAVKVKVGLPEFVRDLERLHKVREALGPNVKIMMDANQGMSLPNAIKLSTLAADIDIHWFEEPVGHTDFAGYQLLRQKTGIALAMGEREYDMEPLKALIARNALDLWQPDLIRIGGVEEWRKSAYLANCYNIPVLPHYYKDYDVPLLCTVPNPYGAESFDWIDNIIDKQSHYQCAFDYQ
jgi:L-alanine-DL-glutamate epimerase-like enolase superfamily enzyme